MPDKTRLRIQRIYSSNLRINLIYYMSQHQRIITWAELKKHTIPSDCWIVVESKVYNVTDFLVQHPGGDEILLKYSGLDATSRFLAVPHSDYAISLRNARQVGIIETSRYPQGYEEQLRGIKSAQLKKNKKIIKIEEPIDAEIVKRHRSEEDCWIIINDKVYDVTTYLEEHPGGLMKIMEFAGKNATQGFDSSGHSLEAIQKKEEFCIGKVKKSSSLLSFLFLLVVTSGLLYAVSTFL